MSISWRSARRRTSTRRWRVAALEAGRGVLVEKPLATTLDDADRIVAAADGLLAATGFQLRCHRKLPPRATEISGVSGGPYRLLRRTGRPAAGPRGASRGPVARAAARRGADRERGRDDDGIRLEAVMRGGARPHVDLPTAGPPATSSSSTAGPSISTGWTGCSTACATPANWAAAGRIRRRSRRSGRPSPRGRRRQPSTTGAARLR